MPTKPSNTELNTETFQDYIDHDQNSINDSTISDLNNSTNSTSFSITNQQLEWINCLEDYNDKIQQTRKEFSKNYNNNYILDYLKDSITYNIKSLFNNTYNDEYISFYINAKFKELLQFESVNLNKIFNLNLIKTFTNLLDYNYNNIFYNQDISQNEKFQLFDNELLNSKNSIYKNSVNGLYKNPILIYSNLLRRCLRGFLYDNGLFNTKIDKNLNTDEFSNKSLKNLNFPEKKTITFDTDNYYLNESDFNDVYKPITANCDNAAKIMGDIVNYNINNYVFYFSLINQGMPLQHLLLDSYDLAFLANKDEMKPLEKKALKEIDKVFSEFKLSLDKNSYGDHLVNLNLIKYNHIVLVKNLIENKDLQNLLSDALKHKAFLKLKKYPTNIIKSVILIPNTIFSNIYYYFNDFFSSRVFLGFFRFMNDINLKYYYFIIAIFNKDPLLSVNIFSYFNERYNIDKEQSYETLYENIEEISNPKLYNADQHKFIDTNDEFMYGLLADKRLGNNSDKFNKFTLSLSSLARFIFYYRSNNSELRHDGIIKYIVNNLEKKLDNLVTERSDLYNMLDNIKVQNFEYNYLKEHYENIKNFYESQISEIKLEINQTKSKTYTDRHIVKESQNILNNFQNNLLTLLACSREIYKKLEKDYELSNQNICKCNQKIELLKSSLNEILNNSERSNEENTKINNLNNKINEKYQKKDKYEYMNNQYKEQIKGVKCSLDIINKILDHLRVCNISLIQDPHFIKNFINEEDKNTNFVFDDFINKITDYIENFDKYKNCYFNFVVNKKYIKYNPYKKQYIFEKRDHLNNGKKNTKNKEENKEENIYKQRIRRLLSKFNASNSIVHTMIYCNLENNEKKYCDLRIKLEKLNNKCKSTLDEEKYHKLSNKINTINTEISKVVCIIKDNVNRIIALSSSLYILDYLINMLDCMEIEEFQKTALENMDNLYRTAYDVNYNNIKEQYTRVPFPLSDILSEINNNNIINDSESLKQLLLFKNFIPNLKDYIKDGVNYSDYKKYLEMNNDIYNIFVHTINKDVVVKGWKDSLEQYYSKLNDDKKPHKSIKK